MPTLEMVFASWLTFLFNLRVDESVTLNPPATESEIHRLETVIGRELPDELRQLYLIANGQQDPYRVTPKPGEYSTHLFLNYEFLSIEGVIAKYQSWQETIESIESIGEDSNEFIYAVEGHPVEPLYWSADWIPVSGSGANGYAIDLSPARGGNIGQLINFGADDDARVVIATSLLDFFQMAVDKTEINECTLRYGVEDNSDAHVPEEYRITTNDFTMELAADWLFPVGEDFCIEPVVHQQPEYINESNAIIDRFREAMTAAGEDSDYTAEIIEAVITPFSIMMEMKARPDGIIPGDYGSSDGFELISYVNAIRFDLACRGLWRNIDEIMLGVADFSKFHQHLALEGLITDQQYRSMDESMTNHLPVDIESTDGNFSCSVSTEN